MAIHPTLAAVTRRIRRAQRGEPRHLPCPAGTGARQGTVRGHLSCTNLAHAFAAFAPAEKCILSEAKLPNIGIVSAYNDMLSAHQPLERFPAIIKQAAREAGGVAQFAGGVPAMCDGVTQGEPGMELSLFSRDVIAMATAVALSHNMFDAALCLGICDKIVPGLLIGALHVRPSADDLRAGRADALGPAQPGEGEGPPALRARARSAATRCSKPSRTAYHAPGTCTFYGTANSNQMLMEVMGLHLPGAAFVNPNTPLRDALTEAAAHGASCRSPPSATPTRRSAGSSTSARSSTPSSACWRPAARPTTPSTWSRWRAAAGIRINWDDFGELSPAVPLLARIYPNGTADVNHFHAAGGMGFVIARAARRRPAARGTLTGGRAAASALTATSRSSTTDGCRGVRAPAESRDESVLRPISRPFSPDGGLKVLQGNLGRAVIKISAVKPEHQVVEAPALVFDSQEALMAAFERGELRRDFVAVVRFQGPRANGMPELHKLTPPLGVLQDDGFKVALVTDGRMSGASGKVPAAIHVTPGVRRRRAARQDARRRHHPRSTAQAGTARSRVGAERARRAGAPARSISARHRLRPRPRAVRGVPRQRGVRRGGGDDLAAAADAAEPPACAPTSQSSASTTLRLRAGNRRYDHPRACCASGR